jgi:hypothetical protein
VSALTPVAFIFRNEGKATQETKKEQAASKAYGLQ